MVELLAMLVVSQCLNRNDSSSKHVFCKMMLSEAVSRQIFQRYLVDSEAVHAVTAGGASNKNSAALSRFVTQGSHEAMVEFLLLIIGHFPDSAHFLL